MWQQKAAVKVKYDKTTKSESVESTLLYFHMEDSPVGFSLILHQSTFGHTDIQGYTSIAGHNIRLLLLAFSDWRGRK